MPARWDFISLFSIFPPSPDSNDINDITRYLWSVTALLIRRIDDKLKRAFRLRAAENGRSMEEEVRQMLRHALSVPSPEDEESKELEDLIARRARRRR